LLPSHFTRPTTYESEVTRYQFVERYTQACRNVATSTSALLEFDCWIAPFPAKRPAEVVWHGYRTSRPSS